MLDKVATIKQGLVKNVFWSWLWHVITAVNVDYKIANHKKNEKEDTRQKELEGDHEFITISNTQQKNIFFKQAFEQAERQKKPQI